MASRRLALALALATALAVSVPARAMAAPSAVQRETARRLMDEGKARTRAGDKERALEAYQKAHQLMKLPTTGMALANAQLALGRLVEARDVALEVARMPRADREPSVFDHARKQAKELEANLKPRIPTLRIVVKGGPATQVMVDNAELAPLLIGEPVALNPGKHLVSARNAEDTEERADVELAERDGKVVELTLPVPSPAVVVVAPPPSLGQPPSSSPTTSGESGDGRPGERSGAANVLIYGGFGFAVVGLAVGGVTGALTLSKAGAIKPQCENGICDPSVKSDLDSASSTATIATLGFAVAGAGLACGLVGLLLPKTKVESALRSSGTRAAVWVGPGSVGVGGSF